MAAPAPAALALDIDGTLLTDDKVVAPRTVRAVAAARQAGVQVILVSARFPTGLLPIARDLGLDDGYFVASQGALVAALKGPAAYEILHETWIDAALAVLVEETAERHGFSCSRFTADRWLVTKLDDTIQREAHVLHVEPEIVESDVAEAAGPPHKMMVACNPQADTDGLLKLAADIPHQLSWTQSHAFMLEITAADVDKASGLRRALSAAGIPAAEAAAIGDGANDLSMFGLVGESVAMANARDDVKAGATWTTGSNNEDGVAVAIDRLLATHDD